jgi:hypothetical protein
MAATPLIRSQSYLGAQYRRLRTKLGAPKAITTMAHRPARLVYRMLKYGQQYVDIGADHYEQGNRQQQINFVKKKAAQIRTTSQSDSSVKLSAKKFLRSPSPSRRRPASVHRRR